MHTVINMATSFMQVWVQKSIKKLLSDIDLIKEAEMLKEELKSAQGQRRTRAIKRLKSLKRSVNQGMNLHG